MAEKTLTIYSLLAMLNSIRCILNHVGGRSEQVFASYVKFNTLYTKELDTFDPLQFASYVKFNTLYT